MKKKFNFRTLAILCLAFGLVVSLTRCKKYDDDVNSLQTQISALKSDVKKDFNDKVDVQIANLKTQLDANVAKLNELESSTSTTADVESKIAAVKQELVNTLVSMETYNSFKEMVESKIEAAATKKDLDNVNTKLNSLEGRVAALEAAGKTASGDSQALKDFKAKYATEYQGLKDDIADLSAKIAANSSAIQELRDLIKSKVDQSTLDALKDELNKSLGNKADKSELTKLNTDLMALIKALQTGKADNSTVKDLSDKLDKFLNKDLGVIVASLTSRLTSLILIPDYVADNGGALPVINFVPIETECGIYSPTEGIQLKYQLNPSTITEKDINKEGLKFKYNSPMVLSARNKKAGTLEVKATFNKIENGILYVSATPDDLAKAFYGKDDNTQNRIDQIMLEVPSKEDDYSVYSDWVKIVYDTNPKTPFLVKHIGNDPLTEAYELEKTFVGAKAEEYPTDKRIVELPWNESLDLEKVVEAVLEGRKMNTQMYGFDSDFTFAVDGRYFEGSNNTDQQKFVKLDGSIISTRVYDVNDPNKEGYNKAAIGREPIVYVALKRNGRDCLNGYLKLKITKERPEVVQPIVYSEEFNAGTFTPQCKDQTKVVVNTQTMNEKFYAKVKMSKEDFHNEFALYDVDGGVGAIAVKEDDGDKTSYNLTYTLTKEELWANAGKTITKKAEFRNAADAADATKTFKIKFTAKVAERETITLSDDLLTGNYWYNNFTTIKQNVAIPDKGATDPDEATFSNNINNAFHSKDNKLLDFNKPGYTYEYVFDNNGQLPGVKVKDGSNGKVLEYMGEEMATIERIDGEGDMLTYSQTTKAKELLNKAPESARARVVLVVKNSCGERVNVKIDRLAMKDRFDVIFLRPINVEAKTNDFFKDGVDFGDPHSFLDVKNLVNLSDWRKNVVKPTSDEFNFLPYNPNYYDYYGVSEIRAIEGRKFKVSNLDGYKELPETVIVRQTPDETNYAGEPDTNYEFGTLTYKNNGNNFNKQFIIHVPVKVTYKWGEFEAIVDVVVKPTQDAGNNP